MANWAQIFISLLFHAYVAIHQVRILVFDNYQGCPVPLKQSLQSYEVELTIEDSNFRTTHCVLEYEDADDEWIDVCCEDGEVDCEGTTPLNDEWEERVETEEADCKGQEE